MAHHNVQLPAHVNPETLSEVLNMLAGPPSPTHTIAMQLQRASNVADNFKKLVAGVIGGGMLIIGALWYIFGVLNHVDNNTEVAKRFVAKEAGYDQAFSAYTRLSSNEAAYNAMVKEWGVFTLGPSCDLARLRQMEWQQDLGLTNHDIKERNLPAPSYKGPADKRP
jgi:hypothetical protein